MLPQSLSLSPPITLYHVILRQSIFNGLPDFGAGHIQRTNSLLHQWKLSTLHLLKGVAQRGRNRVGSTSEVITPYEH
jgi:hypothetical protein